MFISKIYIRAFIILSSSEPKTVIFLSDFIFNVIDYAFYEIETYIFVCSFSCAVHFGSFRYTSNPGREAN